MRLHLLLLLCFALTAWSSQVGAFAMAHCQTHKTFVVQAVVVVQANHQATPQTKIDKGSDGDIHHPVHDLGFQDHAKQDTSGHAANYQTNLHDCCDQSSDWHHCSGSCPSCDGCSTAHGVAMSTVWLVKTAIAQSKIHYFNDFYLRSYSSTQERPPKD